MVVPVVADALTRTISENVPVAPDASAVIEQLTVPVAPTTGVVHVNVGPAV
jgi:hypothetical protein